MPYIGKPQSADPITVNSSNITDASIANADLSPELTSSISGSLGANASVIRTLDRATVSGSFSQAHLSSKISGIVSASSIASSAQGQVALTTNGVAATAVDLGLQSGDSPTFAGGTITGNLSVGGTLTAQEIHTEFESASIIFTSGSTIFGDTSDDVHNMTGSLNVSGGINLNDGTLTVTNTVDFNGDLDVDGTTNLDVVDIDGAVDMASTLTVANQTFIGGTADEGYSLLLNIEGAGGTDDVPGILFKNTSASNDEEIMSLLGTQGSDSVAAINIKREANADDAYIDFMTQANGGSMTERLRITSAGHVSASGNISIIKGNAMLNVEEIGGSKAYLFSGGSFTALRTTSNTPLQFGANYSSTDTMYIVGDKVGIGTNNPSYPLTISDAGGLGFEFSPDHAGGGYNIFQNYNRAGSAYVPVWYVASEHKFYSGGTEVAQIDSSGNVGIGTDNPGNLLHVEGDLGGIELHSDSHRIGRIVAAGSSAEGRDAGYFSISYGGTDTIFASAYGYLIIDDQGRDRTNLELRSDGDVNHGMTNYDDTRSYLTVKKASTNGGIGLSGYTGGGVAHEYNARYTTDSSGQSTGTQAPFNFRVQKINGVSAADVPAGKNLFTLRNNGTTRFIFNADGTAYAADSWTTFSDERLKKDVKDMSYGLEEINKLKPKTFILYDGNFDEEGNVLLEGDGKKQIGFIAQEMKEIVPEMISNPNQDLTEGFYALDDGKLTSVLVKAVQELSQKNEALEKRIQELEK